MLCAAVHCTRNPYLLPGRTRKYHRHRHHHHHRSIHHHSARRPFIHCTSRNHRFSPRMPDKKPFERLPKTVVPSNYRLKLEPDLKQFTFAGSVVVNVSVNEATDKVVLNCVDINISKASFVIGDKDVPSSDISYSGDNETATIIFPSPLETGKGKLHLDFTGELNDKMKGFYRGKYTTPAGEERFCAVTQFEATDARRAFPCWDEPAIKATFDVTLVVPADRVALSNMNEVSNQPSPDDPKLKVVTFGQTPVMSTYLLAFVVGEFDYVEGKSLDGVCVRVYTPSDKKEQGQFALEVAVKTLPFYKEYFNVAYPLPKIDLIAIPDFAAGAMENWGLVTYRESALLVDPKNSSASAKQWVALVVGHELAHQWFGNLVTMEWWTHLWLNEGFASWIEYLCVDHCFPEYDIWTQFITTDYTRALGLDALKSSHPIEVPVGHPDEVDEIFDLISYSKGSSIIRMVHDYIGDEAFRKGMNVYLKRYMYSNTFTEDLWEALGEASGKCIKELMSTWTLQMGFPVLKVASEQKGSSRVLTISQSKFCADGPVEGESPQWKVPINIATSADPTKPALKVLLGKPSLTVTLENVSEDQWVKLNPGTIGFYRVHYSTEMLDALLPAIQDNSMPPRDRLGLESDLFALARAGQATTVDVLKVMEAFSNETNYTVWMELATNLGTLSKLLTHTDFRHLLKEFIKKIFKNIYEKLGWNPKDGEGHLESMLRSLTIRVMGRNGHTHAVEEANKRFKKHCAGEELIPADLRAPVYLTALSHGDQTTFDEILKLFRAQDLQEEKDRILRTLGSIKDPILMQKVLDFSLTEEVRAQDTVFVIGGLTRTKEGQELAWAFLQEKWEVLVTRYSGGFLLSRLVQYCTEGFASEDKAQEVEAFFKTREAPSAERTIKQSVENIRLNAEWLARDASNIQAWLKTKAQL